MADDSTQWVSASDAPEATNAAIGALLQEAQQAEVGEKPVIPPSPNPWNRFPAGLLDDETGKRIRDFEVRELTGADEERVDRVRMSGENNRIFSTILEAGIARIGNSKPTPEQLDSLLLGDRDYAALAIRIATFGPEVEFDPIVCTRCNEEYTPVLDLNDVPVKELGPGGERFEVPLRKGGRAYVRLANGADQVAVFSEPNLTPSEINTATLERCVLGIDSPSGERTVVAAFPSAVKNLSVVDRKAILAELSERQPGPRYADVVVNHSCGEPFYVPVGLGYLFPGI